MTSAQLFAGKAGEYARYRADYPESVVDAAFESVELGRTDVVADLGSGTGMLSRWLLERGTRVFGVEPDPGMRGVAKQSLAQFGGSFASIAGTAEQTSLPDASVSLVTAGNAFHYFEARSARVEVERILQPGGRVLLIAHDTVAKPNPFMCAYLDFVTSIAPHDAWAFHEPARMSASLNTFFGSDGFHSRDLGDVAFCLTRDGLLGRFLSTSVAPSAEDPRRPQVVARLFDLFESFQQQGTVSFQLGWRYTWSKLEPAG
jgi:SAM-dependent methyltransferase